MGDGSGWEGAAAFAGWLLGVLPRLALYPGGLILALAALLAWWDARRPSPPHPASAEIPHSSSLIPHSSLGRVGLALAWLAAALLPLPGAAPLPLPPDLLVLAGLLLAAQAVWPAPPENPAAFGATALRVGALAALATGAGRFGLPLAPIPLLIALPAALAYGWGLAIANCGLPIAEFAPGAEKQESALTYYALRITPHVSRFTFHVLRLGWAGLGLGLLMGGGAVPSPWDGLLAGAGLAGAAVVGRVSRLQVWAARTQGLGWLALGVALMAALLAPGTP